MDLPWMNEWKSVANLRWFHQPTWRQIGTQYVLLQSTDVEPKSWSCLVRQTYICTHTHTHTYVHQYTYIRTSVHIHICVIILYCVYVHCRWFLEDVCTSQGSSTNEWEAKRQWFQVYADTFTWHYLYINVHIQWNPSIRTPPEIRTSPLIRTICMVSATKLSLKWGHLRILCLWAGEECVDHGQKARKGCRGLE